MALSIARFDRWAASGGERPLCCPQARENKAGCHRPSAATAPEGSACLGEDDNIRLGIVWKWAVLSFCNARRVRSFAANGAALVVGPPPSPKGHPYGCSRRTIRAAPLLHSQFAVACGGAFDSDCATTEAEGILGEANPGGELSSNPRANFALDDYLIRLRRLDRKPTRITPRRDHRAHEHNHDGWDVGGNACA